MSKINTHSEFINRCLKEVEHLYCTVDKDLYKYIQGMSDENYNALRVYFKSLDVEKIKTLSNTELAELIVYCKYDTVLFTDLIKPSWFREEMSNSHRLMYKYYDEMWFNDVETLILIVFRGFAKSTGNQVVGLKAAIFGLERYLLVISETKEQASLTLDAIGDEARYNDIVRLLFGNLTFANIYDSSDYETDEDFGNNPSDTDEKSKKQKTDNVFNKVFYRNNNARDWTYFKAVGMTSRIRGFRYKGYRPTMGILDDFESESNSDTPQKRERIVSKLVMQIFPIGDKDFRLVIQGTIVNPAAVLAEIKEYELRGEAHPYVGNNYRYLEKAICSDVETYGKGTWEERYNREWYFKKKRYFEHKFGHGAFLQEYFNVPIASSNPCFSIDLINEIDVQYKCEYGIQYIMHSNGTKIPVYTYIGMDPAYSSDSRADNTDITVIAVTPTRSIVILDKINGKLNFTDKEEALFQLIDKYHPEWVTIEGFGAALEFPQRFQRKCIDDGRNVFIRIYRDNRRGKSNKLLEGLSPDINDGKISYVKSCNPKVIEQMKQEMKNFSGGARDHDDSIDGLFLAMDEIEVPYDTDINEAIRRATLKDMAANAPLSPFVLYDMEQRQSNIKKAKLRKRRGLK